MCNSFGSILTVFLICACGNAFADMTHDWSGWHAGILVGGAAGASVNSSEPVGAPGGFEWEAPYNASNLYRTSSSAFLGGTLGYDWIITDLPLLIGLEGEYGYLNLTGSSINPNSAPYTQSVGGPSSPESHSTSIGSRYGYGIMATRLGYVEGETLVYLKAGIVLTSIQTGFSAPPLAGNYESLTTSAQQNVFGYVLGGGLQYSLDSLVSMPLSIRLEYLYLGFDHTLTSSGVASGADNVGLVWSTTDQVSGVHSGRLGLELQF